MALTEGELRAFLVGPYPRLLRAVTLITGSPAAAEDAVHEALARAWERRSSIEHLDRWVLVVACNLARSRWRKVRREVRVEVVTPTDDGNALTAELVDLDRAVRGLPDRQREVVVLHYLLGLPVLEVAEVCGLSEGGVKHALFRARRSLAVALGEHADDDEEVRQ